MNRIALLPLLVCVLALSACGGDDGGGGTGTAGGGGGTATAGGGSGGGSGDGAVSKDEYQERVNAIMGDVQDAAEDLQDVDASDTDALADSVDKAQDFLTDAADDLAEIDPPADIASAHEELIAGIRANAKADGEAVTKLKDGDRTGAMKVLGDFASTGAEQILGAMKAILAKGYDIKVFKEATAPAATAETATAQTLTAPSG